MIRTFLKITKRTANNKAGKKVPDPCCYWNQCWLYRCQTGHLKTVTAEILFWIAEVYHHHLPTLPPWHQTNLNYRSLFSDEHYFLHALNNRSLLSRLCWIQMHILYNSATGIQTTLQNHEHSPATIDQPCMLKPTCFSEYLHWHLHRKSLDFMLSSHFSPQSSAEFWHQVDVSGNIIWH